MASATKPLVSLLAVCIVLLYLNISSLWRSQGYTSTSGCNPFSSSVGWFDSVVHRVLPLPVDYLQKKAITVAAEKALVEKVKASIVHPAVKRESYSLARPFRTFFSQAKQDELVARMTKKKVNGTFFEAGALDGELFSNTLYLERSLGWTGLLVEPGEKSFMRLKQKRRRARLLRACLSPDLEATERNFDSRGGNSPYAKLSEASKRSESVSCYPLYTILQAMEVPIIDYLSLDIEGDELKVLHTVPWERVKVRVLGVEITRITPEGSEAVQVFMEHKGFVFYARQGEDYFFYHPDYASELDVSQTTRKRQ